MTNPTNNQSVEGRWTPPLEWRDIGRFAGAYVVITIVDVGMFKLFGFALNDEASNSAFAIGYTVVAAIRETAALRARKETTHG